MSDYRSSIEMSEAPANGQAGVDAPLLHIEMLGGLRIRSGDTPPVELPRQQTGALLAYLGLHLNRATGREEITAFIWPDDGPDEARHKLRQSLYALRRLLGSSLSEENGFLLTTRTTVRLNPDAVTTDATRFEETVHAATHSASLSDRIILFSEAVALYQGELLPGFYQDEFLVERNRLEAVYRSALHALTLAHEGVGDLSSAIETARRAVAADPLMEEAHCDLMRLYAGSGQPSFILRQFQELKTLLKEELDEEPSEVTIQLMESLRQKAKANAATNVNGFPNSAIAPSNGDNPLVAAPMNHAVELVPAQTAAQRFRRWRLKAVLAVGALTMGLLGWARLPHGHPATGLPEGAIWAARIQNEPGDRDSEPTDLKTDSQGNVYVTGYVRTATRDVDYVTMKYGPDGGQLWQSRFNGTGNDVDRAASLAVDSTGSVYVTGDSFSAHTYTCSGENLCEEDIVTVKYNANGRQLWAKPYDGPHHGRDEGIRVALDGHNGIYVLGLSRGAATKSGGIGRDMVLLRYAADGTQIWERRYEQADPAAMAVDQAGNVCVLCGAFRPRPGGKPPQFMLVVLRYDLEGRLAWRRELPTPMAARTFKAIAIAIDPSGCVAVSGYADGCNVARYSPDGRLLWQALTNPGDNVLFPTALGVDSVGAIYVTGTARTGSNPTAIMAMKYEPDGRMRWLKTYRGSGAQENKAFDLTLDNAGHLFVTGHAPFIDRAKAPATDADGMEFTTLKYDIAEGIFEGIMRYSGAPARNNTARRVVVDPAGCPIVAGLSYGGRTSDIAIVKYRP